MVLVTIMLWWHEVYPYREFYKNGSSRWHFKKFNSYGRENTTYMEK